jgi:hypothetical protein
MNWVSGMGVRIGFCPSCQGALRFLPSWTDVPRSTVSTACILYVLHAEVDPSSDWEEALARALGELNNAQDDLVKRDAAVDAAVAHAEQRFGQNNEVVAHLREHLIMRKASPERKAYEALDKCRDESRKMLEVFEAEAAAEREMSSSLREKLDEIKWEFRACCRLLLDKIRDFDVEEADRLGKRIRALGWEID